MNRRALHPGCKKETWDEFVSSGEIAFRVKMKNRRIIGYKHEDGYRFGFFNLGKSGKRIYCHSIMLSKEAVDAMRSIINSIEKNEYKKLATASENYCTPSDEQDRKPA